MSAYICEKAVFVYLLNCAMNFEVNPHGGNFRWYHNGQSHALAGNDYERAVDVANMLQLENIRSVSHRYPHDKSSANLPGTTGEAPFTTRDFLDFGMTVNPIQLLKTISCLRYQSCEHNEWSASEAHAFLHSLEQSAIRILPGWNDAQWGAPDRATRRTRKA